MTQVPTSLSDEQTQPNENKKTSHEQFKQIYLHFKKHYPDLEPWKSYYYRRYTEFLSYYDVMPEKRFDKVLELGCSIGYHSAMLSKISDRLIATDLEQADMNTHSLGLDLTRRIIADLDISTIDVQPADMTSLPFSDNSFDLVFSSHTLEHVPDMEKAISEINRVLKPGGYNFCVVPTPGVTLLSIPFYYIYLLKRAVVHAARFFIPNKTQSQPALQKDSKSTQALVRRNRLVPPPHGANSSIFYEIIGWRVSKWRKIIQKEGQSELITCRSTQVNPLLPLGSEVNALAAAFLHKITRRAELLLGRFWGIRSVGYNIVIVTRKIGQETI